MSLHNWSLLGAHTWIGLENYTRAFSDPDFRDAFGFTLEYTAVITPVLFFLGLGLALLVRRRRRGARFFQSVYFMPVVHRLRLGELPVPLPGPAGDRPAVRSACAGSGWSTTTRNWFAGHWSALLLVVVRVTWKFVGMQMLLLLAGLQSIPDELEEAARIDGARGGRSFRYITLPLLRPTLALVLVFSVAGSLLAFDQFFIMTGGGPSNQTITAVYQIYRMSFVQFRLGYGAALSVLLMVVLACRQRDADAAAAQPDTTDPDRPPMATAPESRCRQVMPRRPGGSCVSRWRCCSSTRCTSCSRSR